MKVEIVETFMHNYLEILNEICFIFCSYTWYSCPAMWEVLMMYGVGDKEYE
jgi:hypothetical protein